MIRGIYMATVGLERNRWGSKEPSFAVSEWLPRFRADGFDGVELWENHYLSAPADEQDLLEKAEFPMIFNSYCTFGDEDREQHDEVARAAAALGAHGMKYNFWGKAERLEEYRGNLLRLAETLPADCALLCECHEGTVLEDLEVASDFFKDLDPQRFGVITHVSSDAEVMRAWSEAMGTRLQHLHIQMRDPAQDPLVPENRPQLDKTFGAVQASGFSGTLSLEFTRGIGKEENIETLYSNACVDLAYCREILGEEG